MLVRDVMTKDPATKMPSVEIKAALTKGVRHHHLDAGRPLLRPSSRGARSGFRYAGSAATPHRWGRTWSRIPG